MGIGTIITAAGEAEAEFHIPLPAEVYGLGAFAGLMALLALTFAFRSVAHRQRGPHGPHHRS